MLDIYDYRSCNLLGNQINTYAQHFQDISEKKQRKIQLLKNIYTSNIL